MDTIWTGLIILCTIIIIGIHEWIKCEYKKYKARQKSKASKPVDYQGIKLDADIIYTDAGVKQRIRKQGRELREITWGRRKPDEG